LLFYNTTQVAAVEGEITVKNSGTLRLTWDNGGAPWRKVRHLDYFVNVYQPGADTLVLTREIKRERRK
jgi:hypothetical protein